MDEILRVFLIIITLLASKINTQQLYAGNSALNCIKPNGTTPSPEFLYTCNGQQLPCQTFLIFRSQFPYNSVHSISNLTFSVPRKLARINNVSETETFPNNKEVIVPVDCSCWNQYYQATSSYVIQASDTYYTIATRIFQSISTCSILELVNNYDEHYLKVGTKVLVPLRCACPTKNQISENTNFLLTYLVAENDTVIDVSKRFGVSTSSVVYTNGLSDENQDITPLSTTLIPLSTPPLSNQTITYSPPAISPFTRPKRRISRHSRNNLIGIGVGLFAAFLIIFLFVCFYRYKRRKARGPVWKDKKFALSKDVVYRITNVDQALKVYAFEEIREGTDNFSPQNKLSSLVYRGVIRGQVLCVKKTGTDITKEVNILRTINHFNLITLLGACENLRDFYLIYEYMENGSLQNWLRKKTCSELQSWNYRIQIALDVANGLNYLHKFTNPAYVHKDINTSNVLLNRDLRAKIANFSLARSAEYGISLPKFAQKTKGYIAPEYLEAGIVTPKVDVYVFGVLLLELTTGKEAVFKEGGEEILLSEKVLLIFGGENDKYDYLNMIDPRLQVKHPMGFVIDQSELALRIIKLCVGCLAEEPTNRPSMGKVVSILMKIQMDEERAENWSLSQL